MRKWDERFLDLADRIAAWSKDPSTKVGAVIIRPNRTLVSIGYNGFPREVEDNYERYEDRETKYQMVVHAEINAILTATEELKGCTLYVTPLHPCPQCAAAIIQVGIKRVVSRENRREDWKERLALSQQMFKEANVTLDVISGPSFATKLRVIKSSPSVKD
jgi:dCMP deaminase